MAAVQPHQYHSEAQYSPRQDIPSSVPESTWSFDGVPPDNISLRGGGCGLSLPVTSQASSAEKDHHEPQEMSIASDSKAWPGWAELENDPEIFTIILQEWGVRDLTVSEIMPIEQMFDLDSQTTIGLIFLSPYIPPTASPPTNSILQQSLPWFANQISKFSCGSVALMNIVMNAQHLRLSETLSEFKATTAAMNAKYRGLELDGHAAIRDIHNSFSSELDRMVVDVLLKEEVQKFKQQKAQEARKAKAPSTKKRKRVTMPTRRKKKSSQYEEAENGLHFVAYVQANGSVWKMDGMQADPKCLGGIGPDQTWLNVAMEDIQGPLFQAQASGDECSLMCVTRDPDAADPSSAYLEAQSVTKDRRQEDWAPFIEHMLRLHAEKGDLQEMLDL